MTTSLLNSLSQEINQFDVSGRQSLNELYENSESFLQQLKDIESALHDEIHQEEQQRQNLAQSPDTISAPISRLLCSAKTQSLHEDLLQCTDGWYKSSIDCLKSYNSANNKFSKNVLNNSKFAVDLDEAYSYKLNMDSFPVCNFNIEEALAEISPTNTQTSFIFHDIEAKNAKQENKEELTKAIILHLFKIGQSSVVPEILKRQPPSSPISINPELLQQFSLLNEIVDDICIRHDLNQTLGWFHTKYNERILNPNSYHDLEDAESFSNTEFKFHMLQFIILLNGKDSEFSYDDAVEAYFYSKEHFNKFLKNYLHEMAPLVTLILFNSNNNNSGIEQFSKQRNKEYAIQNFIEKMRNGFIIESDASSRNRKKGGKVDFVSELLQNFKNIHENTSLFTNLANDFVSEYCKDMKLSSDSSLFQSILAGHVYLPSFYKYNKVQLKLKNYKSIGEKSAKDTNSKTNSKDFPQHHAHHVHELPFQLSDKNRFLFKNHPIFICPISREQATPVTHEIISSTFIESKDGAPLTVKREKYIRFNPATTQVVVLNYCHHLALRESIWQLSKKGIDIFKCPYCYKKHKYTDVSDAYFIDL